MVKRAPRFENQGHVHLTNTRQIQSMDAFLRDASSALRRAMTADDNGRAWAWGGSSVADEGAGEVGAQGQDPRIRHAKFKVEPALG